MSERPTVLRASAAAPRRRPGSLRRTTTIDIVSPTDPDGVVSLTGTGRDLLTGRLGGTTTVVAATLRADVAFGGDRRVLALEVGPTRADGAALVGEPTAGGFRRALERAVPDDDVGTLAFLLLDDLPVAALLSATPLHRGGEQPFTVGPPPAGICAGLVVGGQIDSRARHGVPLSVVGPVASPEVRVDDPLSWHTVPPLPPGAVRRRRRLDVVAPAGGEPYELDVMVRDTLAEADARETVIHEFHIRATVDRDDARVVAIVARPHVVPGRECPMATAYVERLVGVPLAEVRAAVGRRLRGTESCTHLSDALRSMGDLATVLPLLVS